MISILSRTRRSFNCRAWRTAHPAGCWPDNAASSFEPKPRLLPAPVGNPTSSASRADCLRPRQLAGDLRSATWRQPGPFVQTHEVGLDLGPFRIKWMARQEHAVHIQQWA